MKGGDLMKLTIVSPEGTLYEGTADAVSFPGLCGSFDVWPNHAPFIAALTNGTIRFRIGDTWQEQAIKGGFVTVRDDSLQVCAG